MVALNKKWAVLFLVALTTMGILGVPSCQVQALIVDAPSYNWMMHRLESTTPPYQSDSSNVIDVPVYVYGTGPQYAFKVGSDLSTDCASAQDYTPWASTSQHLQADISSVADGLIKLCLIGRYKKDFISYNTQPYSKATIYKWMKDTQGPGPFSIDALPSPSNDNTPTISWSASTGATSYDVRISSNPDCSAPVQSFHDVTGTSVNAAAIADGSIHICVTAQSSSGLTTNASNNGLQIVIDTVPPGEFQILAPIGTVTGLSQTASWTASQGADEYHLMVANDAGCTQMVSEWNHVTGTTAGISVPAAGSYHFCAEARDAAQNVRVAPATAFTVADAPQEVVIEDRIGDPAALNGRISMNSDIHIEPLGQTVFATIGRLHFNTSLKISLIEGVGVPYDATGPETIDQYKWKASFHSTRDGAITNSLGGDIISLIELPSPTITTLGTNIHGYPSYLLTFDVSSVPVFANTTFASGTDYWFTILGESTHEWDWMESVSSGESDILSVDNEFVWAWNSYDGFTSGRAALRFVGRP